MIIILLSLSSFLFIIVLILIIYNLIITKKYKYFQSIIETIPEAVLIFTENGKIVDGNNSFLKMFKYHSKELHDISVKNIFEENNISDFLKNSISKQEINKAFHLTGKKKSGEQFFIDVKFKKMKIRKISYILAAISDVAENKAIEKKLRESQRLLSTLISNLPGIAYLSHNDENRSKIFISEGCYELTGYNPSDIIDNKKINFAELIHPDDRKYVWNEVQRAISEKRAFLLTYRIKNAQGQEKWVWEKGRAIFTSEKKLLGLGGFIADITEYKHLEEALATEKERLAVTLRSIADGVITTDIKGKVILINNVAEKLTGWAYEKAQNKDLNKVFCVINEKTRKVCKNPFEKVLESGRIIDIANHSVLISKDGTERQIEDSGAPIKDKNNNIIGVVIVFRDVTEKYKMEEKIAKILKLESLGILAGGIAHDFNNILTPILGNINLAKMYSDKNKELYGLLSEAEKAIHNMKGLTDQLLTFAKGGTTIKKTGSVKKILQENVSFSLRGSNIKYNFLVNNNLWLIDFDEGQMSQVFNNLAINARQAMPKGGCLSISADNFFYDNTSIPFLKKGKYVKIIFEDQGRGIHKEYISKKTILERLIEKYLILFLLQKREAGDLGWLLYILLLKNMMG